MRRLTRISCSALLTASLIWVAYASYMTTLSKTNLFLSNRARKIETAQQLESLILSERKKLGIGDKQIRVEVTENETISARLDKNVYIIKVSASDLNEDSVKHELYHLSQGHCDKIAEASPFLKRAYAEFWYEPITVLHRLIDNFKNTENL